jgi:hypothetical protein
MARRSLRPHLNQIRGWVRQGRTDAWIAHQLEVTVQQIEAFKRENELAAEGEGEAAGPAVDFDDEIDLRAEDDALIAAELEAEQAKAAEAAEAAAEAGEEEEEEEEEEADEDENGGRARRSRRGGRGRGRAGAGAGGGRRPARAGGGALEGTFDHGEEGYGLWLDPAVEDNPVYAEHWAGHRPVEVTIEADQIVIRRTGDDDE